MRNSKLLGKSSPVAGAAPIDPKTLQLLKEGADNAAGKAEVDKKFQQLSDQMRMIQFALGNVFKTLGSYPQVKAQVDNQEYRELGLVRALKKKLGDDFEALVIQEADAARAEAYDELSAADDKEKNLTVTDTVTEDSFVIFTTACQENPDQGVFRSKMDVGGPDFAEFKEAFLGKKVGDSVEITAQGQKHVATILGIRKKPDVNVNQTASTTDTSKDTNNAQG